MDVVPRQAKPCRLNPLSRLLGFLGHLCILGFCCLLVHGLLRFFLVGSFGHGLATTGLAAGALSAVLANACTTTLLAL